MRSASGPAPDTESAAGRLLIQVAAKESLEVLQLADRADSGLVFTGAGAIEAVQAMRRHGWRRPMLTDRRRYAGTARVPGTAEFAPSWLAGQRDSGIAPVLSDSGYIGQGDLAALRAVLGQAAAAGPDVTAVLPLHERWLREDSATLIAEIVSHRCPVALVLDGSDDPLATPEAATGLVDLLRSAPSVALLSAGASALAALAHGAQWAAVGVRAALRGFPPVAAEADSAPRKRRWRPVAQEVLAVPVLCFRPVNAVVRASQAGGEGVWICRCASCRGRAPEWLATAAPLEVDAHSFGVLLSLADRLRHRAAGPAREKAWRSLCRRALEAYGELGLAALGWPPPRLASAWAPADAPAPEPADAPAPEPAGAPAPAPAQAHARARVRAVAQRPRAKAPKPDRPLRSAG